MLRYWINSAKGVYHHAPTFLFGSALAIAAFHLVGIRNGDNNTINYNNPNTPQPVIQIDNQTIDEKYNTIIKAEVDLHPNLIRRAEQIRPIIERELATGKYPHLASMDDYGGSSIAAVLSVLSYESGLEHNDPETGDVKRGPYKEWGIGQILDPNICNKTLEEIQTLEGNIQCSMNYLDEGMEVCGTYWLSLPYYNVGPSYPCDPDFIPPKAIESVKDYYIDPIMDYYNEYNKLY